MPFATVNSGPLEVRLHYELLMGESAWDDLAVASASDLPQNGVDEHLPLAQRLDLVEEGSSEVLTAAPSAALSCPERVLFLPGLAAKKTSEYLEQQVRHVLKMKDSGGQPLACVCLVDLRGIGHSSIPQAKQHYSTDIMGADIVGLLDHLGWHNQVHIVGQSLGALVALKVAAAAPSRLKSLTLLGGALSGMHILRTGIRNLPIVGAQLLVGGLQTKVRANLRIQYSERYLSEITECGKARIDALVEQTEADIQSKRTSAPKEVRRRKMAGRRGQMRACFQHRLSKKEAEAIAQAEHLRAVVLHGLHDRLISPSQVFQLGTSIRGTVVAADAAHAGIGIEAACVVNHVLDVQIRGPGAQPSHMAGAKPEKVSSWAAKKGEIKAGLAGQVINLGASSAQRQWDQGMPALGSPGSKLVKRVQTLPS